MSSISGDATVIAKGKVNQLSKGTEVCEDQIHGLVDGVSQAIMDQMCSLNPGLLTFEVLTLSGGETGDKALTLGKKASAIIGWMPFKTVTFAPDLLLTEGTPNTITWNGITALAIDATLKNKLDVTGTVVAAGKLLVIYLATN